jgi:hypothetical protein
MQNIQEVFIRIQENKKKLKDLKSTYKDALDTAPGYKEVVDQLKVLREKKKHIENAVKENFSSEFTKIDDITIDIQSDQEMMSDIALTTVMKGETVSVKDQYEQEFEPTFAVKFKKVN